ncbi:MAG: hypothetical protein A2284_09115 [Deltaproteobacteria bacterium RIFOXYA12_FULL_61_11]|nr:MAG: hypothetical protein A2284_09115 [Deltaproteobacteria bacterium RIFOXYA12_FULL_61_11]
MSRSCLFLFIFLASCLFVACAPDSSDPGDAGAAITLKHQEVSDTAEDPSAPPTDAESQAKAVLDLLDTMDPALFLEAQVFLQEGATFDETFSIEEVSDDQYKMWGWSWVKNAECAKHYWNPAYWAARMIAGVAYEYKNSYGFNSIEQCKAILALASTAECITAVNLLLGYYGITIIASQYVWLACAVASAPAVSCACKQEW